MVPCNSIPSTLGAENSGFLGSRPAWFRVPGQPKLHQNPLSKHCNIYIYISHILIYVYAFTHIYVLLYMFTCAYKQFYHMGARNWTQVLCKNIQCSYYNWTLKLSTADSMAEVPFRLLNSGCRVHHLPSLQQRPNHQVHSSGQCTSLPSRLLWSCYG